MNHQVLIRNETNADISAITEVTIAAFKTLAISNNTEHFIIEALRDAGVLSVSLVAERDGRVVGHVAFSPVTVSDGTPGWYGLGPVSVSPALHRQGIGKALIAEGLARLRAIHAAGCCLVGNPKYYIRFGFQHVAALSYEGVPPEYFLALAFNCDVPQGTVRFHDAFNADGN